MQQTYEKGFIQGMRQGVNWGREERGKACWEIESKGLGAQATNAGENKTFVDKEKDRKLVRLMRRHMRGGGSGLLCSCLRKG